MKLFSGKKIEKMWKGLSLILVATLVLCGLFVPVKKVKAYQRGFYTIIVAIEDEESTGVYPGFVELLCEASDDEDQNPTFVFTTAFFNDFPVSEGKIGTGMELYSTGGISDNLFWGDISTNDRVTEIAFGADQDQIMTINKSAFGGVTTNRIYVYFKIVYSDDPVTLNLNFTSEDVQAPFYSDQYTLSEVIRHEDENNNMLYYGVFPVNLSSLTSQPSPQPATKGITEFSDSWYYGESQTGLYTLDNDEMTLAKINNNADTNLYVQLSTLEGASYSCSADLWPRYDNVNLPVSYTTETGQVSGGANQTYTDSNIEGNEVSVSATLPNITGLNTGDVFSGWNISFPTSSNAYIKDSDDVETLTGTIAPGTTVWFHIPLSEAQSTSSAFSVTATEDIGTQQIPTLNLNVTCEGGTAGGAALAPDSDTPEEIDGRNYFSYTVIMPRAESVRGFTIAVWIAGEASNDGIYLIYRDYNKLTGDNLITSSDRIKIKIPADVTSNPTIQWPAYGYEIIRSNTYTFDHDNNVHYYLSSGEWTLPNDEYLYSTSSTVDITDSLQGSGITSLRFSKYETTN